MSSVMGSGVAGMLDDGLACRERIFGVTQQESAMRKEFHDVSSMRNSRMKGMIFARSGIFSSKAKAG